MRLSIRALADARLTVSGVGDAGTAIDMPADELRELRVYVTVPPAARPTKPSTSFAFVVTDDAGGSKTERTTFFQSPEPTASARK